MKDYKIVVDTREQLPLWSKNVVVKKLDVGDYSFELNGVDYSDKICIERKGLADAWSTMLSGNKRFHKELERAKNLDFFAMVIEGSYSDLLNKKFPGSFYSRVKSYIVLQVLFTFMVKHGLRVFFCSGRVEAKKIIKELFDAYVRWKNV